MSLSTVPSGSGFGTSESLHVLRSGVLQTQITSESELTDTLRPLEGRGETRGHGRLLLYNCGTGKECFISTLHSQSGLPVPNS